MDVQTLVRPIGRITTATYQTATNANAQAIVPAGAGRLVLRSLVFSYGATPTGGRLLIESPPGKTICDFDITAAGPGVLTPEVAGGEGATLVGTLYPGGSGVVGKLTLLTYLLATADEV